MSLKVTHHVYIPDTQCKPGVKMAQMRWAGQYIADEYAGSKHTIRLIGAGDGADMESLSSWDKGKGTMEGRRVVKDLDAAREGWGQFEEGLANHKHKLWVPDSKDFTLGNHEDRITRAIESDTHTLDGLLSLDMLPYKDYGWTVHDFLKVIKLDGVLYSHYFQAQGTGRPLGGENIKLLIRKIGGSFAQGHKQGLDIGMVYTADGRQMNGLIAGSFYMHNENYMGQGNNQHWRGIVVCHDVRQGQYEVMPVSLDYLCRRYEGKRLSQYLGRH